MHPQVTEPFGAVHDVGDGRRLGYADAGDPSGRPLVLFHGTPSSRLDAVWLDEPAARTGWRIIAPDRPGLGLSSPHPGAPLLDVAADVESLADGLGLERFSVLGYSGGSPYALATARRLGQRVERVGLVSGWGPPDRPGAYDGVALSERLSDSVARRAPALTRVMFAGIHAFLRLAPATGARLLAHRLEGESSTERPTREALGPLLEAFRQGTAGPARDLHLIVKPWEFELGEIEAPVRLWHGDRDHEIPLHHSRYVADAVPDGHLEVIAGGDHLALFRHADAILGDLARDPGDGAARG